MPKNNIPILNQHIYFCFGANGLVGNNTCEFIYKNGGTVIGCDISSPKSPQTFKNFLKIDVSSKTQLNGFFKEIQHLKNKSNHFCFLNCAYPRTQNWGTLIFENVSEPDWNHNIEFMLGIPFQISRQAVAFLKSTGGGSIINLGSIYGINGPNMSLYKGTKLKNNVIYSAAKTGLIGLTKYISTTYGKNNIRANLICPGGIFNGHSKRFVSNYKKLTPLNRMAIPDDIAPTLAMMGSKHFSYVSGQVLMVDGGWSSW